jgi:hypothetical protein
VMPAPAWCQGIDADEPSVTVFAVDPRRFVGVLCLRTDQGTSHRKARGRESRTLAVTRIARVDGLQTGQPAAPHRAIVG